MSVYQESNVRPVLESVLRTVLQSKPLHVESPTGDMSELFKSLEVFRSKNVSTLMGDGDHSGYAESFRRVESANAINAIMGKVNWREFVYEKLMWAFAAETTGVLRERLVVLTAYLVRWLVEIDVRISAQKAGKS